MTKRVYTEKEAVAFMTWFLDNFTQRPAAEHEPEEVNMSSKHRERYTYVDQNGEQQSVYLYGEDKAETDRKFQRLCMSTCQKNSKWDDSLTFRDFVELEYKPNHMVPPFVAETTLWKYTYNLKHYIYPFIGEKKLTNITVNDIQQFRKTMAEASQHGYAKNLTTKSIEDMTGFLNKIFKVAVAVKAIEENPVKRALLKKVGEQSGHFKPLDPEDLDRCKKAIPSLKDDRVRIYAALLFFNGAGMRPEEILGLRWENIDLDKGYADISRAVTYAGSDRHAVVKSTKTPNSVRGAILPKVLVDILKPFKAKSGYLIHGRDPEKPIPYSGWQRTYRKMQECLGIKGQYCNYDLRSTYATELIEEGYSSAMTAKMMGHKDSRMVETVYARTRASGIEKLRDHIESKNAEYSVK